MEYDPKKVEKMLELYGKVKMSQHALFNYKYIYGRSERVLKAWLEEVVEAEQIIPKEFASAREDLRDVRSSIEKWLGTSED